MSYKRKTLMKKKEGKLSFLRRSYFVWLIIGIFVVFTVLSTIQTSAFGARLARFEEEEQSLRRKNQALSNELVNSTSLTSIGEIAQTLGFGKPGKVIYIKPEETFAKLP